MGHESTLLVGLSSFCLCAIAIVISVVCTYDFVLWVSGRSSSISSQSGDIGVLPRGATPIRRDGAGSTEGCPDGPAGAIQLALVGSVQAEKLRAAKPSG